VAVAGLLSLMVTWWSSPIDTANANRFGNAMFGLRDIVPMGYAAFAFALGVTTGVLMRRTLPAMASTLVVFVAARLAEAVWVRPHLMPPLRTRYGANRRQRDRILTDAGWAPGDGQPAEHPQRVGHLERHRQQRGAGPTAAFFKSACPSLCERHPRSRRRRGQPPREGTRGSARRRPFRTASPRWPPSTTRW
jgi:hypothetical protein